MIGRLITWCVGHRALVMLLALATAAGGGWAVTRITVDAIPDLSDVQVIVVADHPGQAPQIVEQQVTYPLSTAMLSVPGARVVRGSSLFGTSFVYIIFEDGTDLYWARSRVLEQLSVVAERLPEGVTPRLGPDATGVGWVFEYVLVTGMYCPSSPQGLWHDPVEDQWYPYNLAPLTIQPEIKERLVLERVLTDRDTCPVHGEPLQRADVDLAQLRSLQDWYLRYELTAVEGVSEIASVGGFVKQYQVVVDPVRLLAYDLPLQRVAEAIRASNEDVGGGVIELSETEYMVRGLGYLGGDAAGERTDAVLADLGRTAVGSTADGMPIYLRDVADVRVGPQMRRGILEWNGRGETVGGIVVMRSGENARDTIARVKTRLAELERRLPPGVAVRVGYDRSDLIGRAVGTLRTTLIEEMAVVALVMVVLLLSVRSAVVAALVLPVGVLASLLAMHLMGQSANIMSLGGIAIAIGVMVDSAIVMVENAHKHLERMANGGGRVADGEEDARQADSPDSPSAVRRSPSRVAAIVAAATEVGPSLFFSLLIITVSFLPVFALGGEAGRMFRPLALTKTFAMAAAAVIAVTLIPVLMIYLLPRRVRPERRHVITRLLQRFYDPAFALVMRFKWPALLAAALIMAATLYPLSRLGSEFMPPLDEGDLLYMPSTVEPGLSITKARELLQQTDKLLMQFPEVRSVMGKIGRADTATDPAPMNMIETTIALHRDKSRWRRIAVARFFDDWPPLLQRPLSWLWPTSRVITTDELIDGYVLADGVRVPGMNEVLQIPGLANAWTMPIRTRIDMLATGIRTPLGVKVMGDDLDTLGSVAAQIAEVIRTGADTAAHVTSAFAERTTGGHYLDIDIDRNAIARHGLSVAQVQDVIVTAIGGRDLTQTVEGLERYPVNLRYPRELRDDPAELGQVLVSTPGGAQIPLAQLATLRTVSGPPMIKSENARLTSWVYIDFAGIDAGTFVTRAQRAVAREVELPPGCTLAWSGQYESMREVRQRLMVIVPLTLLIVVVLLYAATRSWLRVGIVLLALPFSLVGAVWLLYLLDYHLSLAVWVGLIALAGLDAETGLVMLLYLDNSFERFKREGRMRNVDDLWWAVHDGAVKRIRPKTMTVLTTFAGLLPLMWATGAGADTMRRLAAPLVGGLTTSFILELLLYPVIFYLAKRVAMRASQAQRAASGAA